jgi:hypothetical protein
VIHTIPSSISPSSSPNCFADSRTNVRSVTVIIASTPKIIVIPRMAAASPSGLRCVGKFASAVISEATMAVLS